jgi:hypothetical protein
VEVAQTQDGRCKAEADHLITLKKAAPEAGHCSSKNAFAGRLTDGP